MQLLAGIGNLLRLRNDLAAQVHSLSDDDDRADSAEGRVIALRPLQDWLDVMEAVGRGSDAHLFLAVRFRAMSKAVMSLGSIGGHGGPDLSKLAELGCGAAHFARYGRGLSSDVALLRDLEGVRARLTAGSTVASRISALAWEMDRKRDPDNDLVSYQ